LTAATPIPPETQVGGYVHLGLVLDDAHGQLHAGFAVQVALVDLQQGITEDGGLDVVAVAQAGSADSGDEDSEPQSQQVSLGVVDAEEQPCPHQADRLSDHTVQDVYKCSAQKR
jgi:hypothetical protein